MKNESIFSCEHIFVRCIAGRTDAFCEALYRYLKLLLSCTEQLGSGELTLKLNQDEAHLEWPDGEPSSDCAALLVHLPHADTIDVHLDICGDIAPIDAQQKVLLAMLQDGSLKDCVTHIGLIEEGQASSLLMTGLYHGTFLHGAVPFTPDNQDILVETVWSSSNHRAEFEFDSENEDAAYALTDALESHLEVELKWDADRLIIDGVCLSGRNDVRFYRETLENLAKLAHHTLITGVLVPESDTVFALLRFVQEGSAIVVQTAVAEE